MASTEHGSELLKFCGTADLSEGDRVRHRTRVHLTGSVKALEWNRPGVLSAIPYCIAWDDSEQASTELGAFFVYASDHTVEALPQQERRT